MFSISLDNQETAIYKTLSQQLTKCFGKPAPQEYSLNTDEINFTNFKLGPKPCMKQFIIGAMIALPLKRGTAEDIKSKIKELYTEYIDGLGSDWEITCLKTFSRHKNIILKTDAIYSLNKTQEEGMSVSESYNELT